MDIFDKCEFGIYNLQLNQILTYRAHPVNNDKDTMVLKLLWEDDLNLGVRLIIKDWENIHNYIKKDKSGDILVSSNGFILHTSLFLNNYSLNKLIAVPIKDGEYDFVESELLSRL